MPTGVEIPEHVGEPAEPPHVLYAGRLSEEKGILEFVEATEGLPRVIVGDGPLRDRVPEAVGFVPPAELGALLRARAVVCVPSRREGYGMTAREAMAYGRAGRRDCGVGGLADLSDGVTLVEPVMPTRWATRFRALLDDSARRADLGEEGRQAARVSSARRALHERSWPYMQPRSASDPDANAATVVTKPERLVECAQDAWMATKLTRDDDRRCRVQLGQHLLVGERSSLEAKCREVDERPHDLPVGAKRDDRPVVDASGSGCGSSVQARATLRRSKMARRIAQCRLDATVERRRR